MTLEEAKREVSYAAGRFAEAKREDFPLRVVLKRYRAVYEAMHRARMAGVQWDQINDTIKAAK